MKLNDVTSAAGAAQLSVARLAPDASAAPAVPASPDPAFASPPAAFSEAQLKAQVDGANEALKQANEHLSFQVHEGTNMMVVRLVDAKTDKVLKEFPSEHFLDVVADLEKVAGLQVDETR
jgi:uncharacterized FlaG/YvyC family protein